VNPTNADKPDYPWLQRKFFENQEKFPPEDLLPYAGKYIAWNWDGDRVLDSADDREVLWDKLVAAGIDPHHVVFDHVDDV
jgi:hypothetical protein